MDILADGNFLPFYRTLSPPVAIALKRGKMRRWAKDCSRSWFSHLEASRKVTKNTKLKKRKNL